MQSHIQTVRDKQRNKSSFITEIYCWFLVWSYKRIKRKLLTKKCTDLKKKQSGQETKRGRILARLTAEKTKKQKKSPKNSTIQNFALKMMKQDDKTIRCFCFWILISLKTKQKKTKASCLNRLENLQFFLLNCERIIDLVQKALTFSLARVM